MRSGGRILTHNSLDNLAVITAQPGLTMTAIRLLNPTAGDANVQLFDASVTTGITLGTTMPAWVVNAAATEPSVGDGLPNEGVTFTNGIVAAVTTTVVGTSTVTAHLRIVIG